MQVSEPGYYDWRGRQMKTITTPSKRTAENQELKEQIKLFHWGSRMTYGYRMAIGGFMRT